MQCSAKILHTKISCNTWFPFLHIVFRYLNRLDGENLAFFSLFEQIGWGKFGLFLEARPLLSKQSPFV